MKLTGLKSGKFAEELYFIIMASEMKDRVRALGIKYGFSDKELRNHIHHFGNVLGTKMDMSMQDTMYVPNMQACG